VSDVGKVDVVNFYIANRAITLDAGEEVFGVIAALGGLCGVADSNSTCVLILAMGSQQRQLRVIGQRVR
jgi:hypothetical protein